MWCRPRIGTATLGLVTMMISAAASAQEQAHSHELHFAHPLFTESVSPDTKVRFSYDRSWEEALTENVLELEGEYAFDRSFSIEVGIPYAFVTAATGGTRSRLADVEVALKFANFAFEHSGVLLGYGLAFGLPTGDAAAGIGSDRIWELEPFLNAGWQRGGLELVGWIRFGIPVNLQVGDEIETELHYDVSALYHVTTRLEVLTELNGQHSLAPAGDGTLSVSPGLKFAPRGGRPLRLGIAASIPLRDEELDARVRLSLFYHF